jgi:hypothetical protein
VPGTRPAGIGGLLVGGGGIVYVIHIVLRSLLTHGVDPAVSAQGTWWVPVNALGAIGAMLVSLGLPTIYARMAEPGGTRAAVGFALVEAAWMFFGVFLSLYGALVLPWLADEAPRLVDGSAPTPTGVAVAFALGLLAWLAGAALLAIPFVKGTARPRWVGYVLPGLRAVGAGGQHGYRAGRSRGQPGAQPALEPGTGAAPGRARLPW